MADRLREAADSVRRAFTGVRVRLFAFAVLILLLGILVTVLTMRQVLITRLDSRVQSSLEQEVNEFRNLATGDDPRTGRPFGPRLRPLFSTFLDRNVPAPQEQLITFVGGELYRTKVPIGSGDDLSLQPSLARDWRSVSSSRTGSVDTPAGEVRYLAVPVDGGPRSDGVFVVTYLVETEQAEIDDAVRTASLAGLVVLLIGSLVAYLAAGRVLKPVSDLTTTARRIEESDLTARIEVTGRDELAELGRTFNGMLDRLEQAFGSQRDLIRNVSHELRTPITIVRGHLELLDDDPREREETVALVTDELDRMSRLVDDLLTLAKSERPDFLEVERVPVEALMEEIHSKAEQLGEREWRLRDGPPPGSARLDRQRVTQALLNLADNAVHQTGEGDPIELGAARRGPYLELSVSDSGGGVPAEDRERLFERFARGRGGARYSGTGLGLAIAMAVAEAHGGTVRIGDSALGGAEFTILLPVAPAAAPAPRDGAQAAPEDAPTEEMGG